MSAPFEPDVLQDFLTESSELLDQLDADLVELESAPGDPELTNRAFRALHTIKGSASFLALTELVEIAHVAEDALNAARKEGMKIDRSFMDLILEAVDVIRRHLQRIAAGQALEPPPERLISALRRIGAGAQPPDAGAAESADASTDAPGGAAGVDDALSLPESKADLLSFMVEDVRDALERLAGPVAALNDPGAREEAAQDILEVCEGLARTTEFFEFRQMSELVGLLSLAAEKAPTLREPDFLQLTPRLQGALALLASQADALESHRLRRFPIDTLSMRILDLALGNDLSADALLASDADACAALARDGAPLDASEPLTPQPAQAVAAEGRSGAEDSAVSAERHRQVRRTMEQTIRVEVERLESLQNLVGELVLQKNRLSALSRAVALFDGLSQETREAINQSTGDLDRVTSDIQVAVMRTRMQPLDKLFGKYPRLIRDLARKTNKQIELVIGGGDTEVDKSVLEAMNDPLVHLLRNAADHGVESPERRAQAGKPATGTIHLDAAHEGGNVRITIADDGAGLDRARIAAKAVERGLVSAEEARAMTDKQVYRFIFAPGFSTAEQVSDLSGRGVGMDVVRASIENVKGHIDIDSRPGEGTMVSILIPLTVAIMPAMMVGVGGETYAIPLSNILQIVRPADEQVATVRGRPVLRLRGSVIPLVSLAAMFETPLGPDDSERFALVARHNDQQVGLLVGALLGQQEIVIKPLDEAQRGSGPVSGATIRDDGGVSLIVDVAKVVWRLARSGMALAA